MCCGWCDSLVREHDPVLWNTSSIENQQKVKSSIIKLYVLIIIYNYNMSLYYVVIEGYVHVKIVYGIVK